MNGPTTLQWSGSFTVLHPTLKSLDGDKIVLPQSALEQLLQAAPSQRTGSTTASHNPFHPYAASTSFQDEAQKLPNPLMFRLVNSKNNTVVYAGIREFSAPEGTIILSRFLLEALGIREEDLSELHHGLHNGTSTAEAIDLTNDSDSFRIAVHAQQLPKGTYARLRPLEAGYNPDDWRPILERQLRQGFTTLTRDTVLAVKGGQGEEFRFLLDKFEPEGDGICVVETDIEVDIEALNEEQARETLRQIASRAQSSSASGTSTGGEIDIWKGVKGQVVRGDYVDYSLSSWNKSQPLEITLSSAEDEDGLDLLVTPRSSRLRALPRDTAHVLGDFSIPKGGVKAITISPTNVELDEAESVLISIHAYRSSDETNQAASEPLLFELRAKSAAPHNSAAEPIEVDDVEHSDQDEQCRNCMQWVPKRTMVLHENFCKRNNVACPQCHSVFKRGSPEWETHWHCQLDDAHGNTCSGKAKHDDIFHTERQCLDCEFSTNSVPDLARHRTTVCPGKLILCRFCHLEVPQEGDPFNPSPEVVLSGMSAHELADGARTTECHLCDKIVRLRDMEMHLKHHELDKVSRTKPEVCRNVNCGRTLHGVGPKGQVGAGAAQSQAPGNDIGLCSICFSPLYASMHDPEGKALRRRIERRYLGQLMKGCGKSHCGNEWCKTGRSRLDLEAKGASASAALPLVKPLIAGVTNREEPMFFCVDEGSQTRRKLAEMMAAEKAWDVEWCIAAAEAEKGSPDKMRDWLQAWAPRR
ncbi:hypothetical protein N3K66_008902 [Trichothecium roseum]|uniref:Uncharacterized protein n=1 Tax=Trichothecium roseum TaxID=47278 RepID=A0ACC0USM9_9HYPO|nr:hypothetical protein N3K66_008902 [Trichothecium roseum]